MVTRWRRFDQDRLYVSFGAQCSGGTSPRAYRNPHTPHFLPALYTARADWQSIDHIYAAARRESTWTEPQT